MICKFPQNPPTAVQPGTHLLLNNLNIFDPKLSHCELQQLLLFDEKQSLGQPTDGYSCVYNVLGHVAIIVYGCLLLCNSLFEEVLKRSGTFEKSKKFSKIRQI